MTWEGVGPASSHPLASKDQLLCFGCLSAAPALAPKPHEARDERSRFALPRVPLDALRCPSENGVTICGGC